MLQAAVSYCLRLDAFPFPQKSFVATVVDVGRCDDMKWSCFLGQVCGLAKMHLVCVHAALRISAWVKYAASGVRLSSAV